jgi:transposase InsO family protein
VAVQYCCKEYVGLLKTGSIRISMTENGDPYENAPAEPVNGILKDEWLYLEHFHSFEQAKERISQVIKIYNEMLLQHENTGSETSSDMI